MPENAGLQYTGTVRITLNDGRVAVGAEAERFDRIFGTDENLTETDVSKYEALMSDATWRVVNA